jgi:ribosomal protein S18 acetylase RimI-like enzyme
MNGFISPGGELHLSNLGQLELLRAVVEKDAQFRTTARGFSMQPFIRDRDVLTISPMHDGPSIGEVVAFTQPDTGKLAIHRIVGQTDKGWLIKGDNCLEPDGVVAAAVMIGRVSRVERGGREIRLGMGRDGRLIAALSRHNMLLPLRHLWMLPRRVAGFAVRSIQSLLPYRRLARRFMAGTVVSGAGNEDMEAIHDWLNPFGPRPEIEAGPNVMNLVAKQNGKLIGFVQLVHQPPSRAPWAGDWLFSLQVQGRYRGMGIGTRLTRRVIEEAAARGVRELLLVVYEDNDRAIRLYRNLGFRPRVLAGIEPLLEEEKRKTGRRRIAMGKEVAGAA